MKDLCDTEGVFIRELFFIINNYVKSCEGQYDDIPKALKNNKHHIFSTLKNIAEFHQK